MRRASQRGLRAARPRTEITYDLADVDDRFVELTPTPQEATTFTRTWIPSASTDELLVEGVVEDAYIRSWVEVARNALFLVLGALLGWLPAWRRRGHLQRAMRTVGALARGREHAVTSMTGREFGAARERGVFAVRPRPVAAGAALAFCIPTGMLLATSLGFGENAQFRDVGLFGSILAGSGAGAGLASRSGASARVGQGVLAAVLGASAFGLTAAVTYGLTPVGDVVWLVVGCAIYGAVVGTPVALLAAHRHESSRSEARAVPPSSSFAHDEERGGTVKPNDGTGRP